MMNSINLQYEFLKNNLSFSDRLFFYTLNTSFIKAKNQQGRLTEPNRKLSTFY